jgi:hypothetical protein
VSEPTRGTARVTVGVATPFPLPDEAKLSAMLGLNDLSMVWLRSAPPLPCDTCA